jgi:hypothetical protein
MSNLNKVNDNSELKLSELFSNLPLESDLIVTLPSEGKFYEDKNSQVTISPIKFEDEKQLVSSYKNNVNPINLLLTKCVKNLDIQKLLLIDKLYLLLKIRQISYGESYPAIVTCPKCKSESEIEIKLNELLINPIPEDLTDPRELNLPKLNKKAKVRFPRVSDEAFLVSQQEIYNNVWRFVVELNGSTDPVFIAKAIPKLPIMDVKKLIKEIMREDLGLSPKFLLDCDKCGKISEMEVPINENFFSVS